MKCKRNIGDEMIEGIRNAVAHMRGEKNATRVTIVSIPDKTTVFRTEDYPKTPNDIADYLNAAFEDGNPQLISDVPEVSYQAIGNLPPVHPGEILKDEIAKIGITPYALAKRIKVYRSRIYAILHGKRSVSCDTALRLECFFGVSAEFWLRIQGTYKLKVARQKLGDELLKIRVRG